ncbi:hypothetical protein VAPA_1c46710 [Variovorax paradoxus B4]|uniref:Uncharacterized protein n=1 Tax=Variovorax paradoxus B4 TaxID=1246301 RepID=T1XHD2_VARPD|nr:hypothetical protein VAPA_1c46710 [Variovorax paradoxus B4]
MQGKKRTPSVLLHAFACVPFPSMARRPSLVRPSLGAG